MLGCFCTENLNTLNRCGLHQMKVAQWQLWTRNSSGNECNSLLCEYNLHNHRDSSLHAEHKHARFIPKETDWSTWKINARKPDECDWRTVSDDHPVYLWKMRCRMIEACLDQDWYFHYKLWYILETLPCGNEKTSLCYTATRINATTLLDRVSWNKAQPDIQLGTVRQWRSWCASLNWSQTKV